MKTTLTQRIGVSMMLAAVILLACNKSSSPGTGGGIVPPPAGPDSIYNPVDPAVAPSIGFFLNSWSGKTFTAPENLSGAVPSGTATDSLTINVNKVITKVPSWMYGNNSNLWMGQYVTQPALMQYIKDLSPHIIRAPAGSVSDIYFFNGTDASPAPADAPANLLNSTGDASAAGYWYGGNTASWTFSLSNYYELLAQTNSTGIITVNYGYARYGTSAEPVAAAAHLAAEWVRYDNGRTQFWEIGNESYGNWEAGYQIDQSQNKDGQPLLITGALYGQHFLVFADSMRAAAQEVGATIYIGATLFDRAAGTYDLPSVQTWNQGVLEKAGGNPDFFIVHNYFTAWNTNSTASDILTTGTEVPNSLMTYLHQILSASGVGMKPIALTEWNIQAVGSKQNVSYIAGMHAAKTVGSLIKNQFGEASRWDFGNGYDNGNDHGMFNVGDEPDAPKWNPRPAFYYLYYFQRFFGDRMVFDELKAINSDIITYSSTFSSGEAGTVIINSGSQTHILAIDFQHFPAGTTYYWYTLTGGTHNGSFSGQVFVNGTGPSTATGGPLDYASLKSYSASLNGTIKISVPPLSVIYLVADKK